MSVRGIYKYVLAVVTNPSQEHSEARAEAHEGETEGRGSKKATRSEGTATQQQGFYSIDSEKKEDTHVTFEHPVTEAEHTRKTALPAIHGTPHYEDVTYRERLGGYLHPRDMRRLVTPFSASNEPGIIVRRHVMLFNFDPLRAIILRDRLLVM
jgi:hypothetical protein